MPASVADSGAALSASEANFELPVRRPYNGDWVLSFLEGRAVAGVEAVEGRCYRRRLGGDAWLTATLGGDVLQVSIPRRAEADARDVAERLRRLFDLDADPVAIDAHLGAQPALAPLVRAAPGIRVPGVWDAFEGAVRAILGQQVSVRRARSLAEALCAAFGAGAFPSPAMLADADVAAIGMPGARGRAVSALARRVCAAGDGWLHDAETLRHELAAISGIGPWTAEYAAMRIARDPDAFPETDWGVFKALGVKGSAARKLAAPWRPWRAYATMLLWSSRSA